MNLAYYILFWWFAFITFWAVYLTLSYFNSIPVYYCLYFPDLLISQSFVNGAFLMLYTFLSCFYAINKFDYQFSFNILYMVYSILELPLFIWEIIILGQYHNNVECHQDKFLVFLIIQFVHNICFCLGLIYIIYRFKYGYDCSKELAQQLIIN